MRERIAEREKIIIHFRSPVLVAQNSQSLKDQQCRATEESATMYKDPLPNNNISINPAITLQEVSDAIVNLGKTTHL